MKARLIAVGENPPSWVATGFEEYRKRLSHWLPLDLVEIAPGMRGKGRDPARAIDDEGSRVLAALPKNTHVILLDGPGTPWTSEQLAQRLENWRGLGRDLALLIGGPEGHAADVAAADDGGEADDGRRGDRAEHEHALAAASGTVEEGHRRPRRGRAGSTHK